MLVSEAMAAETLRTLLDALVMIARTDPSSASYDPDFGEGPERDYAMRNAAVYSAVGLALQLGWSAGFRPDEKQPDWPVAYIMLPTGQVSWHLPAFPDPYNGHTTADKYDHITQLCRMTGVDL